MTTGGAPRAGVAGRLRGPALSAALLAGLLAGLPTTGCGASANAGASATPSPPPASTTSPEELCTRIVAHWSREVLDSTAYGDYQSMGLSNGQYEILRTVVDAARAVKQRQGPDAADELIGREAAEGCARRYRSGGPTEGPWQ
ncbi:hypothetical protein OHU34_31510 [Streptomyces sp. NBC_00080]|uniref:hypothetical protein n=1 Tax=Streptomyces TaxID=1883 RepID=UPI00116CBD23|nr:MULTISPECIES: hypothetical protein [Streptomyces]TQJ48337.1 hypothetical protein FBY34_7793 [Streptomyces sp. SLBN-115]